MRTLKLLLPISFLLVSLGVFGQSQNDSLGKLDTLQKKESFEIKHKKGITLALAVALGPLGGHRLYLQTRPLVPIVYAVTLGGGLGILPLIDFIAIAVSKDLSKYEDNDRIIMWL